MIKINEIVKNLREKIGITQDKLAEQLAVSKSAVANWESGRQIPASDKLIQIIYMAGYELNFETGTNLVSHQKINSENIDYATLIYDNLTKTMKNWQAPSIGKKIMKTFLSNNKKILFTFIEILQRLPDGDCDNAKQAIIDTLNNNLGLYSKLVVNDVDKSIFLEFINSFSNEELNAICANKNIVELSLQSSMDFIDKADLAITKKLNHF